MRKRHSPLRLAIMLATIADSLRRAFYGTRPIDWVMLVIELLVLVFIAPAEIAHFIHWARIRRRKKKLWAFQSDGIVLQEAFKVHFRNGTNENSMPQAMTWMRNVAEWKMGTAVQLEKYSAEATAVFWRDSGSVIKQWGNKDSVFASYAWLEMYLKNLTDIIQNADTYL